MKPPRLMLRRSLPSISPWVRASSSFTFGLLIAAFTWSAVATFTVPGFTANVAAAGCGRGGGGRALLSGPLHPAAVEQRHVRVAVVVHDPPQPRRVDAAALVVRDHARGVRDAEPRHQRFELLRRRQERRRRFRIADPVVVEEHRLGNVAVGVAARPHVDDADVGVVEVLREPGGVDEQFGPRVAASTDRQPLATDCLAQGQGR